MTDHTNERGDGGEPVSHRASKRTYEIGADERPSEAVVRAIGAYTDTVVVELEPLFETVDPDRLDGLFGGTNDRILAADSSLTFRYHGCLVTVDGETVTVRRA